ncbi:gamma carbonic anhydrase family protein [Vibrio hangzhouensis]|uniref:gamma carbonic anhydrase family protein n=1 Tax=Vibrio hangzhouensis TaxID=462991 RepID=UPI001C9607F4|nr:gamma carbonic anhydrase family protein [Vibrio hangzhouensis]MBY6199450.1 gamma carbonic anhydrase family protein [Vibrio hangzhouensis]
MTSIRSYKGISPQLDDSVYIDETSVIVGDVRLGKDASVWPLVAARGDVNHIIIGERTNIQDNSVLHVTHKNAENPEGYPLIIGNDVTIGHKVMLHGCTIKDRVLVGMGSIVLDGAIIESDVMIGAGSLVPPNKILESGYLYVGSPVKQARPLTDKERAFLVRSANNYVQNKNDYMVDVKVIR